MIDVQQKVICKKLAGKKGKKLMLRKLVEIELS
jgi:hypothetical protein